MEVKNLKTHARAMPFTEEQMAQIYGTNLIDFAVQHGFVIDPHDKKHDKNCVHVKNSDGLYLFRHGRGYKQFKTEASGNIVDFVKQFMGATDFKSAAEIILGCRAYEQAEHFVAPVEKKARGDLVLPPKDNDFNRTIAYLVQTRGIDKEIVYAMINQNKVYQSRIEKNGSVFRNCAFVGYDGAGKPRYCALRAPSSENNFRQDIENSDKTYGFSMEGRSNRVYEFEAPIDAMSHATLCKLNGIDWREDHRISEGCLSDKALHHYLKEHPEINEIVFCYDNDIDGVLSDGTPHNHGQVKAQETAERFANLGYTVFIQTPNSKDFNNDLNMFRGLLASENISTAEELER